MKPDNMPFGKFLLLQCTCQLCSSSITGDEPPRGQGLPTAGLSEASLATVGGTRKATIYVRLHLLISVLSTLHVLFLILPITLPCLYFYHCLKAVQTETWKSGAPCK